MHPSRTATDTPLLKKKNYIFNKFNAFYVPDTILSTLQMLTL